MPTPDRFPGEREEDTLRLTDDGSGDPSVAGQAKYQGGAFRMRDAVGVFNPRLTDAASHAGLDTLLHALAETHYMEVTRAGGVVVDVTQWETAAKLKKVRQTVIARAAGKVSQIDVIQYDAAGVENERMTGAVTRDGAGKVANIAWTRTP